MKKWSKVLFVAGALVLTSACFASAYASTSRGYVRVSAEGEETSEVVEQPQEEKESWVKKSFDTYVVPLLSGVSLTSIVSAVACIVTTIIKNKQLDKKLLTLQEEDNKRRAEADAIYQSANEKLAEATEILQTVRETYRIILENDVINKETKKIVLEKLAFMSSELEKQSKDVKKVEKLQEVIGLLVQLQSKIALQTTEAVKSGVVDDVNKILQLVKSI